MTAKSDAPKRKASAGVAISHADRVLYPASGVTKGDLAAYLERHGAQILTHLADRPLSLVRCPDGVEGTCFFQKHPPATAKGRFDSVPIATSKGVKPFVVVRDVAGLVQAAQMGAIEFHIWGARADNVELPDRLVLDLDPDEGLPFEHVRSAALDVRDVMDSVGLRTFPMLTGGKGIHVIAPLRRRRPWPDIEAFAKGLATRLAEAEPERFVATMAKAKRKGRVFVDWLRNQRGSTAIAPYSPRANPHAKIATPIAWSELERRKAPEALRLKAALAMSDLPAPWDGYNALNQTITEKHLRAVADDRPRARGG